jgi:hypothetical protein
MLDYESALVNFEAVQQAPAAGSGDTVRIQGGSIVQIPIPAPQGLFRPASGNAFQQ